MMPSIFQVGEKVPNAELHFGFPPEKIDLSSRIAGRNVILLSLPGAFTPTWYVCVVCRWATHTPIFSTSRVHFRPFLLPNPAFVGPSVMIIVVRQLFDFYALKCRCFIPMSTFLILSVRLCPHPFAHVLIENRSGVQVPGYLEAKDELKALGV